MKSILIAFIASALLMTPAWPQPRRDLTENTVANAATTPDASVSNSHLVEPGETSAVDGSATGSGLLPQDFLAIDNNLVAASEFTFSVTGDIPYTSGDVALFVKQVADHNLFSPSDFLTHVGDIKSGASPCVEPAYLGLASMLKELTLPTFVIPGDNEWNDCANFDEAWSFWEKHFMAFEENFCGGPPTLERQEIRPENFAFTHKGVLIIGLNIVGGLVHDTSEWATRLQQNADWVSQHLAEHAAGVRAAVILGHAGPHESRTVFFDQLVSESTAFGKPVIYIHGDGHVWRDDHPFPQEPNIRRIQIQRNNPPLHVTVTLDPENPFALERDPWPKGTQPFNQSPCVDVRSEMETTLLQPFTLEGLCTDDGVPGNVLSATWSQVSGPGEAKFSDLDSCTTTVLFTKVGSYELLLTADDTELQDSGQILVDVLPPVFSDDFESGTTSAWAIAFP